MELQVIQNKICEIRHNKVILDFDLSEMYGIETKHLKQAVRRNIDRFPPDFMFELTREEYNFLRTQIASLENGRGKYTKYQPFAFTEQGVAMLSSVLNSKQAIAINISIMRAFVAVRVYLYDHASVSKDIADLWKSVKSLEGTNEELLKDINDLSEDTRNQLDDIYMALTELAEQKKLADKPRPKIGYIRYDDENN
jgi:hypothetical protein